MTNVYSRAWLLRVRRSTVSPKRWRSAWKSGRRDSTRWPLKWICRRRTDRAASVAKASRRFVDVFSFGRIPPIDCYPFSGRRWRRYFICWNGKSNRDSRGTRLACRCFLFFFLLITIWLLCFCCPYSPSRGRLGDDDRWSRVPKSGCWPPPEAITTL